jgi:hypothetical protein
MTEHLHTDPIKSEDSHPDITEVGQNILGIDEPHKPWNDAKFLGPDVQDVQIGSSGYEAAQYVMRDRQKFLGRHWEERVKK